MTEEMDRPKEKAQTAGKRFDAMARKLAVFVLRLLRREPKEETVVSLAQFVKFGVVGASNTLVSYLINVAVLKLLQPLNLSWDYVAGNVAAFLLSVLWSFYWNNKYVFTAREDEERSLWRTLLKTYVAYGFTGIVLTNVLSWVWVDVLGVSKYVAPALNLVISIPLNFVINKLWAYRA